MPMTSKNPWGNWYPRKDGTVEPEVPKLVSLLRSHEHARILDLGCGAGRHVAHLARAGFAVWGLDAAPDAIAKARKVLDDEGLSATLDARNMNDLPLPFEDGFFDAVIATRAINHNFFAAIRRIATEIDRLLARGGYLFLQVGAYSAEKESPSFLDEFEEPEPRTFIPLAGDEQGVPHHTFTREELDDLFPGYRVIELHSKSDHYVGFCYLSCKT